MNSILIYDRVNGRYTGKAERGNSRTEAAIVIVDTQRSCYTPIITKHLFILTYSVLRRKQFCLTISAVLLEKEL
jgi:hypothetical protein